jgi:hypothetical protein
VDNGSGGVETPVLLSTEAVIKHPMALECRSVCVCVCVLCVCECVCVCMCVSE